MTLAAFIVFVTAVLVIVVVHAWSLHKMLDRQRAQDVLDEGRRQAVYQQQKAFQTELARMAGQVEVSLNAVHASQEAARLSHARVDGFFSHPEVKRMLDAGASGRGG